MPAITRDFPSHAAVRMEYEVTGSGDPPIVLVHGYGCARADWAAQVEGLSPTHRVLACDLPGHGTSTRRVRGCRVEHLGVHVAALLEAEDLRDAYLVGHSMGCRVVMQASLEVPDRVAGLVLVDGSWIGRGDPAELETRTRAGFEASGFQPTVAGLFREMFLENADPARSQAIIERAARMDPTLGTELFASLVAWDAAHTERALAELPGRLLVIQSTHLDEQRRRRALRAGETTPWLDLVAERRPDARIEIIPGVGHFSMIEAPERVNALIDELAVRPAHGKEAT